MMHRGSHGRRRFSTKRSPYRVNNFTFVAATNVPGGSSFGATSAFTDSVCCSITTLTAGGTINANQYRSITIGGIRYTSDHLYSASSFVAGVVAFGVVSECWYIAELQQNGASALTAPFLQRNEFTVAPGPAAFPERILFRRSFFIRVGASNLEALQLQTEHQPFLVKAKGRMTERDALFHRIEVSNPTATAFTVSSQVLAAVAVKYELD